MKGSQRTFLTRIAYKIPPIRIFVLGGIAASGFFFTQLILTSSIPSRLELEGNDSSIMQVRMPLPMQRLRQFLQEKLLVDPEKSRKIIQENYPGFGGY